MIFNRKLKLKVQSLERRYERMKEIQDFQTELLDKLIKSNAAIFEVLKRQTAQSPVSGWVSKERISESQKIYSQTPEDSIKAFTQ